MCVCVCVSLMGKGNKIIEQPHDGKKILKEIIFSPPCLPTLHTIHVPLFLSLSPTTDTRTLKICLFIG